MTSSDRDIFQQALNSNDPQKLQLAIKLAGHPLYKFQPFPEQAAFCNDRFNGITCLLAGNGAGKTYCASYRVAKILSDTPPPEKNTPFWIMSQNMDMVTSVCWGQGLTHFIQPDDIQSISWYRQARGLPKQVVLKPHKNGNNYVLEFKSYDQGREALQAQSIIGFAADEQCPMPLLNEVIARTRKWSVPGSQMYYCTPIEPDPELEDRFSNPDKFPTWKFYRFPTSCNKTLKPEFIQQIIENEDEALVQTRLTGAFARYEGQIYPTFGKDNIVEPFTIPRNWLHVRGLDLGWNHMTAMLWAAVDPKTDTYYVYKEYAKNKTSIEDHVSEMQDGWSNNLVRGHCYADPASAQVLYEFRLRGLETVNAVKDVTAGIASVKTLLRGKPPKLMIFNTCTKLIEQIRTYVYDKETGKPKKESENYLYDLCDALRYLCHSHKLNKDEKAFDGKMKSKTKLPDTPIPITTINPPPGPSLPRSVKRPGRYSGIF